jgi:hypothetical protein
MRIAVSSTASVVNSRRRTLRQQRGAAPKGGVGIIFAGRKTLRVFGKRNAVTVPKTQMS